MLKISGGTLYDPANDIDGQVRDLWIDGGRIVAPPSDGRADRTIDAAGLVVMPGGVDMHCHIAGPKVNAARKLRADDKRERNQALVRANGLRSGTLGSVPSTFATAYKYAALGYTSAFDAAVPAIGARQAHQELADTPCLDKGFFVLAGNNRYLMRAIADGRHDAAKSYLAWLLKRAKGYAPKLVNPGGVEVWKTGTPRDRTGLDDQLGQYNLTPRQIIQGVARASNELALPHPLHLHCNQLGMPGNWRTTLETMRALEGYKAHITHIQFHSYGGGEGDETTLGSQVAPLAEYINSHENLSVDVGQVMFGQTTNMTGDGPLGYFLHRALGGTSSNAARWYSHDTEVEAGCGVLPMKYRNKNLFNAMQWAVGLEWYLMVNDPWRVVMSTDHPNGGSFLAYPELIRLLMDKTYRADVLKTCPDRLKERTQLAEMDREYSLNDIAIITRAGPARLLGLKDKGHLGIGADADVTIYTPSENPQTMFELPRMVIKAGEVMVEQGDVRSAPVGKTLCVEPKHHEEDLADLPEFFKEHYSVPMDDYGVVDEEVPLAETVATSVP